MLNKSYRASNPTALASFTPFERGYIKIILHGGFVYGSFNKY